MKLNNDSIFDKAVVVTLIDDKLYYGNAFMYIDVVTFELDEPGILIYNGIDFNGRCAFWVEDDDVFPIVSYNGFHLVIEDDDQYEYLKSHDALTNEQVRLIDKGFDVLNEVIVTGGLIDYNGGI